MRQTNRAGIDLIKRFEGFSAKAYKCPAGILTIGYGHTGPEVRMGMVMNMANAEIVLASDLQSAERAVIRNIKRPLTDNQFASLVSFTFNLGGGALQGSTLRMKCNRSEDDQVPKEFMKWVWAGGKKLAGLKTRRQSESNLYSLQEPVVYAEIGKAVSLWGILFPNKP